MERNPHDSVLSRKPAVVLELEIGPSEDVWRLLESHHSADEISDELGITSRYFLRLAADALVRRIIAGAPYEALAGVLGPSEGLCWNLLLSEYGDFTTSARSLVRLMHVAGLDESEIARQLSVSVPSAKLLLATGLISDDAMEEIRSKSGADSATKRRTVPAPRIESYSQSRPLVRAAMQLNWTIRQFSECLGVPESDVRKYFIVAEVENGVSLKAVADRFQISRERVRQIAKKAGINSREIRRNLVLADERRNLDFREKVREWVNHHPGCTLEEISVGVGKDDLRATEIPKEALRLVLGQRKFSNPAYPKKFSEEVTLDALRKAFEIRNPLSSMYSEDSKLPLSGQYYDQLRRQGLVHGPSEVRVIQVFGSWTAACEKAGVLSLPPPLDEYKRRWTDDQLIGYFAEFLLATSSSSPAAFDVWARASTDRPSSGTVRLQLRKAYSAVHELALLKLRAKWAPNTAENSQQ